MTESETKLMELYVSNLKKTVELIDAVIIPVVNSFDGKVYNARLKNTIQEKLPESIYFHVKDFDLKHLHFELSFWNQYREVYVMEKSAWEDKEHRQVYYMPSGWEDFQICYLWTDFNTWSPTLENNKKYYSKTESDGHFYMDWEDINSKMRINSRVIVSKLTEQKEHYKEQIENLEKIIAENKPDAWKTELNDLKKQVENLHKEIPCVVRDICKIASYATWN